MNGKVKRNYELLKVDLPYSDWIMGLGISSVALSLATGIIGIILGILAIYLYKKPFALYQLAPELYFESSYRNIRVGKALAIIGLVISSIVFVCLLIVSLVFVGLGSIFS
jgi:hypothetical protein